MYSQSQSSSQRGRGCQRPISSQPSQQNRSNGTHASQQSQTQDSSDYDVERMVTEVIQYLLISERKRLPVKKADITKHLALKGNTAKIFKTVMVAAGKFLEDVFGYHLHEFSEKSGHYILRNQLDNIADGAVVPHRIPSEPNTILYLILSAIFLSDGQISEDELWNMLSVLGYDVENHKKLITQDFVKQLYVIMETVSQSDPPKFVFKWGERATLEFPKIKILEFASQIYGVPMEQFGVLYAKALEEDRNK